jgi:large subunit ribosomal protein L3
MKAIIGRKLGMTQLFTEDGELVPVTVIAAGPCPVVAVRSQAEDGYDAVQLAFEEVPAKRLNKPETGHLAKVGVAPHRHLREFRGTTELTVGENVTVDVFGPGDHIKVTGTSIGKGFAGTIKRHNFGRGPESHGSHNVRKPGSIGQSAQPSRVFKGLRMSGHMGDERVTQRGLIVIDRDSTRNVILVSGSVPGSKGGLVEIREDAH